MAKYRITENQYEMLFKTMLVETVDKPEPNVYVTPDDIETKTDWGKTYNKFKGEPSTLGGNVVTKDQLPSELYHVTTAYSKVMSDGMLRHMAASTDTPGLGKGTSKAHWGVSLTRSKNTAVLIERELIRAVELSKDRDQNVDALYQRYGQEDSQRLGVDLSEIIKEVLRTTHFHIEQGEPYAGFQNLKYYHGMRERKTKEENPILFGQGETFAKINMNDIKIITVPTANIPDRALIRLHPLDSEHLDEIMVHADIPLN